MNRLEHFAKLLSPRIKIAYKDESLFMRFLAFILFFNPNFHTKYITTIGETVYYPSRKYVEENSTNALLILAHEYVHILDSDEQGKFIYSLKYLMPQIFALFGFLGILGFWFGAGFYFFFLAFLFLLPLPSPGRKDIELKGYKMSIFMSYLFYKPRFYHDEDMKIALYNYVEYIDNKFFRSLNTYYMMWPFGVKNELIETVDNVMSGDIYSDDPIYRKVERDFEKIKTS